MGDIADQMLNGSMCHVCGEYMGDGDGYEVTCPGCDASTYEAPISPRKVRCPNCRKPVKKTGLEMHMRDKHGT